MGSLPHRQLRNCPHRASVGGESSLPHRQLRNGALGLCQIGQRSLPHRQLRKPCGAILAIKHTPHDCYIPRTAQRAKNQNQGSNQPISTPETIFRKYSTMSMPDGRLSCTACDYRGFLVFRRITLAYHFVDGTTVNGRREMRWCSDCRNPRDVEGAQPAIAPLQTELDALNATFATPVHRIKRWGYRLFGQGADTLQMRADELRGQIKLAETRGNECRCLTCGSASTQPLKFDDNGVSSAFQHECGGHLRLEPVDMDAPRFNYGRETIHLDEAGQRIQWGS